MITHTPYDQRLITSDHPPPHYELISTHWSAVPALSCLLTRTSFMWNASCLVETAGSKLQFVTAIQLRLIVIVADGPELLGLGRPKHFCLSFLAFAPLISTSSLVVPICSLVSAFVCRVT
ncbi:hypothetical protein GOODEAATRI_029160 [Goodea atripinnis]|uniref:Uncharacterized protein n=1 Tax=Goodea atripinnis TaxID=208336 RepID=A0ABV0N557_9TELE